MYPVCLWEGLESSISDRRRLIRFAEEYDTIDEYEVADAGTTPCLDGKLIALHGVILEAWHDTGESFSSCLCLAERGHRNCGAVLV